MSYYFHPKSLVWWTSVAPLASGLFIAAEPLHHLANMVLVIGNLWGGAPPSALIASGLAGIGIRSAIANQGPTQ